MKYFYGAGAFFLGLIILEAVYFGVILSGPKPPANADMIVVFRGEGGRVKAGVELQRSGYAPYLVLSPAKRRQLNGLPTEVVQSLIIEDRARTTFENALYTRKIIIEHGIRSVILVTSDYHAPRSYFLLKSLLHGQQVQIHLYKTPAAGKPDIFPPRNIRSVKILYNEMVKLWGSLGEWAAYAVRGRVPETSTKEMEVLRVMKGMLLFKV